MDTMRIFPPWSEKDVAALKRWQECEYVHPFTCPEAHGSERERVLTPTRDGWVCLICGYRQNWAHSMMLREPPRPYFNGVA